MLPTEFNAGSVKVPALFLVRLVTAGKAWLKLPSLFSTRLNGMPACTCRLPFSTGLPSSVRNARWPLMDTSPLVTDWRPRVSDASCVLPM